MLAARTPIHMDGGEIKGIQGELVEEAMERRTFLGGLSAASLGVLLLNAFARPAQPTNSDQSGGSMAGQDSFESSLVEVSGNKIFLRRYGRGPAILMVPQLPTHQPDVAIPRAKTRGGSHRDLRRLACLRTQWGACIDG